MSAPGTGDEAGAGLRSRSPEGLVIALGVLALGIALGVGALGLDGGLGYQVVGPGVFPMIVGVVATACGLVLTASEIRGLGQTGRGEAGQEATGQEAAEPAPRTRWANAGALAALLVGYALVLVPVGFWQATGLVYATAAWIFGSRRPVRNLAIGYALALATYLLFDRLLAVGLPDGYLRIAG